MNDNWYATAYRLLLENPEATLWDLMREVYVGLYGSFPIKETDAQIDEMERLHLRGYSPRDIAPVVRVGRAVVRLNLESAGYSPWRKTLDLSYATMSAITRCVENEYLDVSPYIYNKYKQEIEHAKSRIAGL